MNVVIEICARGAVAATLVLTAVPVHAQYVVGVGPSPYGKTSTAPSGGPIRVECNALSAQVITNALAGRFGQLSPANQSFIAQDFPNIRAELAEAVVNRSGRVPGTGRSLFTLPDGREVRLQCAAGTLVP